jgi:hypothetical protein
MKKLLTFLTAAVGLTMTAHAMPTEAVVGNHEFKYTIHSARLADRCGDVKPAEGTEYLMVNLTAKNVSSEEHFFGGLFNGQFSVSKGNYHFDVDGGAGLAFGTAPGTYSGIEQFPPLMRKTMTVVFTIPQEIAQGNWTVKTPTDETFEVTVN